MPQTASAAAPKGLTIIGALPEAYQAVLTPAALAFLGELAERFMPRREALLLKRRERQAAIDAGALPDFLPETHSIREGQWRVAPIPADLLDRRVEITGPTERKMVINALNSGAQTFMADCEDSSAPSWANVIEGQINLHDAARGTINYRSPEGKDYKLNAKTAVLLVRPRGWHLSERHILYYGNPIAGSLVDFGLYFFHNARALLAKGTAPYFYLPKLEHHTEATLWNDVFVFSQLALGVPQGTIRATVLIETIQAAFQMDEILHALRDHSAGLNCGRWDYIFSFIKCFRNRPDFVLPERGQVTMTTHFLRSYSRLVIQTCHRRGIHAMGGMAAFIPIKNDVAANDAVIAKVRADKEREAQDGHDGTWVAHPGLVGLARDVFDKYMPTPNQISKPSSAISVTQRDLLQIPEGTITPEGLRLNISVALQYLEAWLRGQGCVPINNLMEDAATAEISRVQLWQWIKHQKGVLTDGRRITAEMCQILLGEEIARHKQTLGAGFAQSKFSAAALLLDQTITAATLPDFLTAAAYSQLD
ncbi:MAG: malate synthase A [Alphaproteobacteria bacterium]|nr:malate synthase A [Alphaproteobacteria bacterium]